MDEYPLLRVEPHGGSTLDVGPSGYSNILLSASCGVADAGLVPFLLEKGFSSRSYLPLLDTSAFKPRKLASVWIVFIALLASLGSALHLDAYRNALMTTLFSNLEHFLNATEQELIVPLGRKSDVKTDECICFTTVEQLVIWNKPRNMQELLGLLGKWRTEDDETPKVPWDSNKWEEFGVVDRPIYQAFDGLHFVIEGVASMREIILDREHLGFRVY